MVLARLIIIIFALSSSYAYANTPLDILNPGENKTEESVPSPFSLKGEWWQFIDDSHENLEERIKQVKTNISRAILSTSPEFQREIVPTEQAIFSYLNNLLELKNTQPIAEEIVLEKKESYSVEEFISLFEDYHSQRSLVDRIKNTIKSEELRAKSAETKVSDLLQPYRSATDNSAEKLKLGLLIMSNRLQWLVWKESLGPEKTKLDNALKSLQLKTDEIEYASTRLAATNEMLDAVDKRIGEEQKNIEQQQKKSAKIREAYTSSLGIDYISRLQERLYAQQITNAEILETQSVVTLANVDILKALILASNPSLSTDEFDHTASLKKFQALAQDIESQLDIWKKLMPTEQAAIQEIITSGTYDSEDKQIKQIVEDRIKTLKITAIEIPELDEKIYSLNLLISIYEKQLGDLKGWLFKLQTTAIYLFEQTFGNFWDALNYRLFVLGDTPITTWDFIQAILSLVITYLLAKFIQNTLIRLKTDENGKIPPAIYTLSRVVFYLIIVLGVIIAFSSMGIDFTKLAIIAGALSVGIGFGLQSVVSNFVSGIIILFEHNIKVGDFIELDSGLKGTVTDIDVRSTIVKTLDNLDIIVPNSELVTAKVTNFTLNDPLVRIHISFGVAYGTDKELVKKAVLEAARRVDITYDDGAKRRPQVWLVGFGDSSLDFELVNWVNPKLGKATPGSWRALYTWEIESALQRYNIEIPFPQRDIHIKESLRDKLDPTVLPEQL
jgi:small-conductance mechanosensitive channel